jgi:FK506-binding protein 14
MLKLTAFGAMLASVAADGLTVTQYEGPTECAAADVVKKGRELGMYYRGTIDKSSPTGEPGEHFDARSAPAEVFRTKIGVGKVIKCWDEGLVGLCKGAKATLVCPSDVAYGDEGAGRGVIPGKATLNFDVEVVSVDKGQPGPNLFVTIDKNGDNKLTKEELLAYFKKEQGRNELPDGMWENEDADGNGFVSFEEFSGPKGDGDKYEDKDELR